MSGVACVLVVASLHAPDLPVGLVRQLCLGPSDVGGATTLATYGGGRSLRGLECIVSDPSSSHDEIAGALRWVANLELKSPKLLAVTRARLVDPDPFIRYEAVRCIAHLGMSDDVPAVAFLLGNDNQVIVCGAASALSQVGGFKELALFDAYLGIGRYRADKLVRPHIRASRDRLATRLADAEKKAKAAPKP